MKRAAMALMVFALGLPSFADVPWTDVETVTAYLTNMLPAAVSDVRVYASSEAVPLVVAKDSFTFDGVFFRDHGDVPFLISNLLRRRR